MSLKPYQYQLDGARIIKELRGRALLGDEQGLGKTITALIYCTQNAAECFPALVVCPSSLKFNWAAEAAHHFGIRAQVLEGMKPSRLGMSRPQLTVISYNLVKSWMRYIKDLNPSTIILDECQSLQGMYTQRTKACRTLCKDVPKVLALSGTPITNRPVELFPVVNIIRPDVFPSWRVFTDRYCRPRVKPWGIDYSGASHTDELHELLVDSMLIRRRKDEVLTQLPPKTRSVIPLPIEHPHEYRKAHKEFLTWMAANKPDRLYKASKAPRLTQVGYLKRLAAQLKLKAVFDWVDSFLAGGTDKLVLFAVHTEIMDALHKRYKSHCVRVDGSTHPRDRHDAKEAFQTGAPRIFLGNIQAAGKGLTLTRANTVAFAELGWTPGEHLQAEDRIHRISQVNHARVCYLVAAGTVEERIARILQEKKGVCDAVVDGGDTPDGMELFDLLCEQLRGEVR